MQQQISEFTWLGERMKNFNEIERHMWELIVFFESFSIQMQISAWRVGSFEEIYLIFGGQMRLDCKSIVSKSGFFPHQFLSFQRSVCNIFADVQWVQCYKTQLVPIWRICFFVHNRIKMNCFLKFLSPNYLFSKQKPTRNWGLVLNKFVY